MDIPQSSVLGPILFLIYINDLPDVVEVLMKLFADNAKLYHIVTNSRENELQLNLDRAVKWAKDWKMFYNTDKCQQFHIVNKIQTLGTPCKLEISVPSLKG